MSAMVKQSFITSTPVCQVQPGRADSDRLLPSKRTGTVKNQFGLCHVLFQVFMTRLTPIVKTRHFLKPTFSDRNRLAEFHSFYIEGKLISHLRNTWGCGDLDSFFPLLPTDDCCLLIVANWQLFCCNIFNARPETYHRHCESDLISHPFVSSTLFHLQWHQYIHACIKSVLRVLINQNWTWLCWLH